MAGKPEPKAVAPKRRRERAHGAPGIETFSDAQKKAPDVIVGEAGEAGTGGATPGGEIPGGTGWNAGIPLGQSLREDYARRGAIPGQPGSGDPNIEVGDVPAAVGSAWGKVLPTAGPQKATGMGGPAGAPTDDIEVVDQGAGPPPAPRGGGYGGGAPPGMEERWKIGPQTRAAFTAAEAAHQKALTDAEDADAQENAAQQAAHRAMADEQQKSIDESRATDLSRKAQLQSYREQMERLNDEAANTSIDSRRLWKQGTFKTIIGLAGAFAAGFVKASTGREVDGVAQAIDRDIAEQRMNYDIKSDTAKRAHGLYGMAMQQFQDERQAEAATRAAMLGKAEIEMKRLGLSARTVEQRNKYELLRAGLADRKADMMAQFLQYAPAGGGGGSLAHEGDYAGDPTKMVDIGGGHLLEVGTTGDAEKIRARQSYEGEIKRLQDEALAVYQKYGRSVVVPGTDGWRRINQIREQALPIQSLATQQGVVREFERDPTFSALGLNYGAGDVLSGRSPADVVQNARKTLGGGSQSMIQQHAQNGVVVRQQMTQKPNGQIVRKYQYVQGGGPGVGQRPQGTGVPHGFVTPPGR